MSVRNRRQPRKARIDTRNPLARLPAFMWVGGSHVELVSKKVGVKSGATPPTWVGTASGLAAKFTTGAGTPSYIEHGAIQDGALNLANKPTTWVFVFTAGASGNTGVALANRCDGNNLTGWSIGFHNTIGVGFSKTYSSVNIYKGISETMSQTSPNVLVITHDGGQLSAGCRIFFNGKEGTYTQQNGAGTTGTDEALSLQIGVNGYGPQHSHDGNISMAGAFQRIWSDAEIASFSRNPWQVVREAKRETILNFVPRSAYSLSIDPVSYTVTAAAETLVVARALTISPASYTLTPSAVTLSAGRAINFSPASYTVTAANETLVAARALSFNPASYSLTASPVTFNAARALSVDPASYAITASAQTLSVGRVLNVSPATYALTAAPETLSVDRSLSIDPASYVISAAAITLTYTTTAAALSIDPVSYAVTAEPVALTATRSLSIDPASYAITAAAVSLAVGRQVDVDAASYSITASPISLIADRSISVEPASYIITSPDIGLTYAPAGSIDYEALAAAVWAYTLSNGKTAEQTLVENNDMLEALSALPNLDTPIEGAFSSVDLLRVIAAVAAGKTNIESSTPGTATVEFRDVNDTEVRVSAEMVGSERASVTINP